MIRRPLVVAALSLVTVLGAACGGGTEEATTTVPTTTSTTLAGGEFCGIARAYYDKVLRLAPSLGDPQTLRALTEETGPVLEQFEATAPPEIVPDVRLLAANFRQLQVELEAVGFEYAKLPPGTVQRIQTPESGAAATRLQAYTREVCGVGR